MHPLDEMKTWLRFGAQDEARLRALHAAVLPRLPEITSRFYERALASPGAARVFSGPEQIERLRSTLQRWCSELLLGPYDLAYYERRERIGRVHVEVSLEARYMFVAMNVVREQLCEVAREVGVDVEPTCVSVGKICDIDLGIMTGTYVVLREARERHTLQELIVAHMPVALVLLDGEGNVASATPASARLFGTPELVGRPWHEALPEALVVAAELPAAMERALRTGHEITVTRVDVRLDGRDCNFRVSLVPLEHASARALIHVEDLTETVSTEARLARSESLAQLGTLSAAVAHELRNPLAGIAGAIQVISRSMPADDRRKPIMEKVEAQVHRLDDLVTDLLDFARPVAPRIMRLDLAESVRTVLDVVGRQSPGVTVVCTGAGVALADGNMVQQTLLNLLLNAAQAMGGQGSVAISLADGQVTVCDDGPGIPEANAERIFQPFFTTRTRGTGLGLAICRKLVSAMGGSLTLGSGPLRGACFTISLPVAT